MSLNEEGGGAKDGENWCTFNTIGKKYKLSYKNTLVEEGPGSRVVILILILFRLNGFHGSVRIYR